MGIRCEGVSGDFDMQTQPVEAEETQGPTASGEGTADQQNMLGMINQFREDNGLGPVTLSDELTRAMTEHAGNIDQGIFHSDDLGGGTMENVAQGQSAEQVFEMWMNSPGHRANMLKEDITEIGVGVDGDKWALNGR